MLKLVAHREELEPSPRGPLPPAATLDSPIRLFPRRRSPPQRMQERAGRVHQVATRRAGTRPSKCPKRHFNQTYSSKSFKTHWPNWVFKKMVCFLGILILSLPEPFSADMELLDIFQNIQILFPILQDPQVQQELIPLLPATLQTPSELYETLNSPQFHQAVNSIEQILHSDQMPVLLTSAGVSLAGMSARSGTTAFLDAIQKDADSKRENKE
jgi:hypothetical protein